MKIDLFKEALCNSCGQPKPWDQLYLGITLFNPERNPVLCFSCADEIRALILSNGYTEVELAESD